mmetsp:Transcript_32596/g.96989  ORF Transcript_32596/g.96989 Transcript_32596/m.96989 type:complete len:344 (-) Transcript_32596:368-1399(-)
MGRRGVGRQGGDLRLRHELLDRKSLGDRQSQPRPLPLLLRGGDRPGGPRGARVLGGRDLERRSHRRARRPARGRGGEGPAARHRRPQRAPRRGRRVRGPLLPGPAGLRAPGAEHGVLRRRGCPVAPAGGRVAPARVQVARAGAPDRRAERRQGAGVDHRLLELRRRHNHVRLLARAGRPPGALDRRDGAGHLAGCRREAGRKTWRARRGEGAGRHRRRAQHGLRPPLRPDRSLPAARRRCPKGAAVAVGVGAPRERGGGLALPPRLGGRLGGGERHRLHHGHLGHVGNRMPGEEHAAVLLRQRCRGPRGEQAKFGGGAERGSCCWIVERCCGQAVGRPEHGQR